MIQKLKTLKYQIAIFVIIILAIFLRSYNIKQRPLHHDESLHAHYSFIQTDNFTQRHYKYNPMLHGPLLYDITSLFIAVGGNNKLVWRLPSLLFGILTLIVLLVFFKKSSKPITLIFLTLAALSPHLIYWSRFLRTDIIIIFVQLLAIFTIFYLNPKYKYLLLPPLVSLLFCLKENAYITLAQAFIISIPYFLYTRPHKVTLLKKELILSITLAIFIYILFYSAFFQHPEGVLDGLYRKSLVYWFNQHSNSRIAGPFSFQSLNLLFYSPLVTLAIPITFIHLILQQTNRIKLVSLLSAVTITTLYLLELPKLSFIIIPIDRLLFFIFLLSSVTLPLLFLFNKRPKLYIISALFLSSLFTYSYVGEKVPWLALYPYVTGLLFLFYYWKNTKINIFTTTLLLSLIISSSLYINYYTNWNYSEKEMIHQVSTSIELEKELKKLPLQSKILVKGDLIWPVHTFLEQYPNYTFTANQHTQFYKLDYIFLDLNHTNKWHKKLSNNFNYQPLPFRRYWWPKKSDYSWKAILNFMLFREPSSPISTTQASLYTRKR